MGLVTTTRLLSLESTPQGVQLENANVSVGIFPIGIDLEAFKEKRSNSQVPVIMASLAEKYAGKKILLGRDKNE